MRRVLLNTTVVLALLIISSLSGNTFAWVGQDLSTGEALIMRQQALGDTTRRDTLGPLPYPFKDQKAFAKPTKPDTTALYLKRPSNIRTVIEYDPVSGDYLISEKIGSLDYRLPIALRRGEYLKNDLQESIDRYWRQKMSQNSLDQKSQLLPQFRINSAAFNKVFGSNIVNIRPQGYVEMSLGIKSNRIENPSIPVRMQKYTTFDFSEKINVNLDGQIGERLKMRFNYNTDATFDFENKIKLDYSGNEDEIVKKVEAGNVSMPLTGTLIRGGTNLFGVKTDLQFGKLSVSTVFSQQKGETKVINTEGGASKSKFEINATDYDANRHFLLGHFFYENYDKALQDLPIIKSAVTINKIEVWVTNKSSRFQESRNILALLDLGEKGTNRQNQTIQEFGDTPQSFPFNTYPGNEINGVYKEMTTTYSGVRTISRITDVLSPLLSRNFAGGRDYEKIENARKLDSTEYVINRQLGYISLVQSLNTDEVLAVAYQYTVNGEKFQVGEFSTDGIAAPNTLILKLLKGTNLNPAFKNWRLMMKNIYNINGQRISAEDFKMDVFFRNDAAGINMSYLPDGPLKEKILLGVVNLDHLNKQLDPYPDGVFDFLEKVTINSQRGRIMFPVIEPFGSNLERQLNGDAASINKYVFRSLYDNTKTVAIQDAEKNKYKLIGSYKGSSTSEISLDAINIARGSVKVLAGGRQLEEDVDFIVDYTQGKVKIINQGLLESGTPISISTESQDLFSMQQKTMLGTHLNYEFGKNFNIGGTLMYLHEQPLYQKVNYGEDPISNVMLGLNGSYNTTSGLITKLVNALPFHKTAEESKIAVEAEYARLLPGHSKVISKEGAVYIDDFEGAKTPISLKSFIGWSMASVPQFNELFPEGNLINDLSSGYNRAHLSWYIIDPYMQRSTAPSYLLGDKKLDDHRIREVFQREIFPDRQTPAGQPTNIPTLDLAYYPKEKGSYNYEALPGAHSAGVDRNGLLNSPETRWAGIMRKIETSDFETANVEYLEFWMMDPFAMDSINNPNPGGDLYFNLGNVSEDILRDGRKSFEHGLPADGNAANTDQTAWGRVSKQQSLVKAFDNSPDARKNQDVGLDGLNSKDEQTFFGSYLNTLAGVVSGPALEVADKDPSNDDYHYFRGTDYDQQKKDVLERYKYFSRTEGNSPTSGQSPESYPTAATSIPDVEDINDDNTLNETEAYYQYHLRVDKNNMAIGQNYIADIKKSDVTLLSGAKSSITWYQYRIPVSSPEKVYGSISDFRSIRFIRMFLKGWQKPVVMRFASLDLVRTNWRRYDQNLTEDNSVSNLDTKFDISAVNVEENSNRKPVNYVVPPGVSRAIDPSNPQLIQLNEQAMVLRTSNLVPGDARGAYKTMQIDMRRYKTLKLEVHAEKMVESSLKDDDLYLFVRLGSDFQYNYYEYEIPLALTPPRSDYNASVLDDQLAVWPEANRVYIPLDTLIQLKLKRNTEMRKAGSQITLANIYEEIHAGVNGNKNMIRVKGNPDLSQVEIGLIGIRNRKGRTLGPKSVEVWVNELRLTNFEEKGGWAAIGRVSGNLADLGTYSVAGRITTTGFGSIDSKMGQRTMADSKEYDISANLELGKFFKKESGVKIPLYFGISKAVSTPEYSPLDKDVKMADALANAGSAHARDSIKQIAQTFTERRSINLTNVQIDSPNKTGKPKIYDLSNFSLTYAYNLYAQGDITTQLNKTTNTRFLLNYNFVTRPVPIDPFKKIKFLKSPALGIVRDFNLNFVPSQISFRSDMNRTNSVVQYRDITNPTFTLPKSYLTDFIWNRYFDFRYDLTRGLKIDFSAINTSRIDQPLGSMDKNLPGYQARRDTIWQNILDGGRNTHYHHTWNITYTIPINKLPLLDWTSSSIIYHAGYDWDVAPLTQSNYVIGNSISNSNAIQINGQADLIRLYNRVPYLKKINQKYGEFSRGRREAQAKKGQSAPLSVNMPAKFKDTKAVLRKNIPQSIFHKLGSLAVTVRVTDEKGKVINGKIKVINENRVQFIPESDCLRAIIEVTGGKDKQAKWNFKPDEYLARFLMMIYNVNISYSENGGTGLYGYLPGSSFLGSSNYQGSNGDKYFAPGLPFIFGEQNANFGLAAANKGWISTDSILNKPYLLSKNTRLNFRAKLVPLPDLKIDLIANQSFSSNSSEFLIHNEQNGWGSYNKMMNGNFSMTIISLGSSFESLGKSVAQDSKVWNKFTQNREIIARRLDQSRVANAAEGYMPGQFDPKTNFPVGYGPTSQEVLIPAFLAAYSGMSAEKVPLSPFPSAKFMLPNWRIQYSGVVNKIPILKEVMKSMSIMHDYKSTYSIGSYISNLDYSPGNDGFSYVRDAQNNFLAKYDIATININETFNPLLDIDITWLNNLTSRFEYRKTRNIMLSLINNQSMELYNNEASLGFGYRFDNSKIFVKTKSSQKSLNNDLNVRLDLTYGKNKTVLRQLVEQNNQTTAGQETFAVKFSADYNLSQAFIIRLFYDRLVNSPFISNSYRTTNSNFGVSFRFTLTQ